MKRYAFHKFADTLATGVATLAALALALAITGGCQPDDHVNPEDDRSGDEPPPPEVFFSFAPDRAGPFLDANLARTNGVTAVYTTANGELAPALVNGAYPDAVGADADLLGGVGFGTYPNPDIRGPGVNWENADPFRSVLTAGITLSQPGDSVTFCRSFATTCVTALLDPAGNGFVSVTTAANLPDVEAGEIAPGLSASVRGTGPGGLTIAITDPNATVFPFSATPGSSFELQWLVERGSSTGSLDWSVSIDGDELSGDNTIEQVSTLINQPGAIALIFDQPLGDGRDPLIDYSYEFDGFEGNFSNAFGSPVDLSPQAGLLRAPLFVYPTVDPDYKLLTLLGIPGAPHAVTAEDAVLGMQVVEPGQTASTAVFNAPFNGDDFAGIPGLEGNVDFGGMGAGFYPSPTLCYSQIIPIVQGGVEAEVTKVVHQRMYAGVANGVLAADPSLEQLSLALQAPPFSLPASQVGYTRVGNIGVGDIAGYITLGTDYADSNVAMNVATSIFSTYTVALNQAVSQTFIAEFNGILGAMEANGNAIRDALIGAGALTLNDYLALKGLQIALTMAPGSQDGVVLADGTQIEDDFPTICNGYDCNVALVMRDIINGTNISGNNPPPTLPGLAAGCLWGLPPTPEVPAEDATLTGDVNNDHPAYPAIPAQPAIPPVREQAAASINTLIVGLHGNFVDQAFGPAVPASNFSVSMKVGDTTTGTAPSVSQIEISAQ